MPMRLDGSIPRVIATTVTYGHRNAMLEEVISGALAAGADSIHVVFNGNGDQVETLMESLSTDVRRRVSVEVLPDNLGSAGGFRAAVDRCRTWDPDYLWILDDDNRPRPDCLSILLGSPLALDPRICHASLRVTDFYQKQLVDGGDPSEVLPYPGQFLNVDIRRRLPLRRSGSRRERWDVRTPIPLPVAPYGGLLVSRDALECAGLPLAAFFLYEDDTEWTRRIATSGFRLYLHPLSRIDDLDGKWADSDSDSPTQALLASADPRRLYFSIRNRTLLDRELARSSGPRAMGFFVVNQALYGVLLVWRAVRARRFTTMRTMVKAVLAGDSGRFLR